MRELLKKFLDLRESVRLVAAVSKPPPGGEGYHLGFLQGKHAGVEDCLTILKTWLEDEDHRKGGL